MTTQNACTWKCRVRLGDFGELVPFGTVIKTFNHVWFSLARDLALVRRSVCFLGICLAAKFLETLAINI
jgi:hypothetical protein